MRGSVDKAGVRGGRWVFAMAEAAVASDAAVLAVVGIEAAVAAEVV